jgi:uncharacterized membrane protein
MTEEPSTWHDKHKASLTRGQRAADIMRNGMGSWPFVGGFIGFMLVWAAVNTWALASSAWDPYPYILLNLFLSMLAGLQGAILLIAAKRQDAIAGVMAQHDYDTNVKSKEEIDLLMGINRQQLEILRELQQLAGHEPNENSVTTGTRSLP